MAFPFSSSLTSRIFCKPSQPVILATYWVCQLRTALSTSRHAAPKKERAFRRGWNGSLPIAVPSERGDSRQGVCEALTTSPGLSLLDQFWPVDTSLRHLRSEVTGVSLRLGCRVRNGVCSK